MKEIIKRENIVVGLPAEPHESAIRRCGKMLVDAGYVKPRYVEGMIARDRGFSTAIGNYIAIPHGEKEYKNDILKTGLSILTYPDGVDWGGQKVYLVIGIAAQGEEHLGILENIVDKLEDGDDVLALVNAGDVDAILATLAGEGS
ncbi:MAG: PTS sugar transporter subunit IIA [Oscillospiraceae bacterium]|jgi:mannitol/fructose-specific phosphotransferase system IIA component|nr:PTS sugar transporter subunit IIA [Oscillospiraceae bacterium]